MRIATQLCDECRGYQDGDEFVNSLANLQTSEIVDSSERAVPNEGEGIVVEIAEDDAGQTETIEDLLDHQTRLM